jgi:hypothetical protein
MEAFDSWHQHFQPQDPEAKCALIRAAIRGKRQVLALHGDLPVIFCPHVLVGDGKALHVLAFLLTGELDLVKEKWRSPKRWRWLALDELVWASARPGPWRTAPYPPPCPAGSVVELQALETAGRSRRRAGAPATFPAAAAD